MSSAAPARIAIVIAAGGGSTRFADDGTPKLHVEVAGRTVLTWTVELAGIHAPGLPLAIGMRPGDELAVALASACGAIPAVAPDAERGLAHTLTAALDALPADVTGACILLGDDPLAALELPAVLAHAGTRPDAIVAVDRPGGTPHPVHVPRARWSELGSGDTGFGHLLRGAAAELVPPATASTPVDVDTPGDLPRLAAALERLA